MSNPLAVDLDHVLAHTEPLWPDVRGQRLFLTGGTGFVGTWLTESLLWANRRLRLGISAVLLTRNPAAFAERSPHLAADPAVTLIEGDGASFEFPAGPFPLIVHAASSGQFDSDTAATRRVLELARNSGAARLLFTSSGAVYGNSQPDSPYAQGKRISETLCTSYAQAHRFDVLIARLFAFTGPYLPLDQNYAVGNFVRDVLAGGPVQILGDGTPLRSYLYAADLAIWLWTILLRGKSAYPYDVGSPEEVSIAELAFRVVAVTQPPTPIRIARTPVPGAATPRYVPDTRRSECELGLRPWISLEEGVRRMYRWYAQHTTSLETVVS